jgi:hypothetical protein
VLEDAQLVRVRSNGLLPAALEQRLVRPVGVPGYEFGDLAGPGCAWRQQAIIHHQLLGQRVGVARGGGLRVRPPVGADRGHQISLCGRRKRAACEQDGKGGEPNRKAHDLS